jgi:deazaflavin-dependent oxidoreductase (nitroreductase family)
MASSFMRKLGGNRIGVWAVKHVVAPLDRRLSNWTNGRLTATGMLRGPILLLTTTGRRTGAPRTTPLFYLSDGPLLVICNVNPGFERPNPWTLNLRANPQATVRIGRTIGAYTAREATSGELERYWPDLVRRWPAYETHYARSGQRAIFILEPAPGQVDSSVGKTG